MEENKKAKRVGRINVSISKQQDLIQLVVIEGKSIVKIAKKLKMKYSRAKMIVKNFKETGELIPEIDRKGRDRSRSYHQLQQPEASSVSDLSPSEPRLYQFRDLNEPPPTDQNLIQQFPQTNIVYFLCPFIPWNTY